ANRGVLTGKLVEVVTNLTALVPGPVALETTLAGVGQELEAGDLARGLPDRKRGGKGRAGLRGEGAQGRKLRLVRLGAVSLGGGAVVGVRGAGHARPAAGLRAEIKWGAVRARRQATRQRLTCRSPMALLGSRAARTSNIRSRPACRQCSRWC